MSETVPGIERCAEGDASLMLDLRHEPLVIVTWFGAPSLGMLDQLQAWYDRLYARLRESGSPGLVMISDATAAGVPSVAARRRIAELRHDHAILIQVIAVAPASNSLLRGVVNALRWVLGDSHRYVVAGSFEQALEVAVRTFERCGAPIPEGVDQLRAGQ